MNSIGCGLREGDYPCTTAEHDRMRQNRSNETGWKGQSRQLPGRVGLVESDAISLVRLARIDSDHFIEAGWDDVTVIGSLLRRLERRVLRPKVVCKQSKPFGKSRIPDIKLEASRHTAEP